MHTLSMADKGAISEGWHCDEYRIHPQLAIESTLQDEGEKNIHKIWNYEDAAYTWLLTFARDTTRLPAT